MKAMSTGSFSLVCNVTNLPGAGFPRYGSQRRTVDRSGAAVGASGNPEDQKA
jgi:hypothetical protein